MATVTELSSSRRTVDDRSHERTYNVTGAADEAAAIAAVEGAAPATANGLVRDDVEVEPVDGNAWWTARVRYRKSSLSSTSRTPIAINALVITGSTSGGTQRITQSLQTVASYAPPAKTAPDFQGAIGVSESGVDGAEIVAPTFRFTATKCFASGSLPSLSAIYGNTGKVSSAAFGVTDTVSGLSLSFAAGELLFEGADFATQREDGGLEISYHFAASPNRTGLTVGTITGIAKKGWEYLWVHYFEHEDATAKRIVRRPDGAYVERVYETADFSGMGR